MHEVDRLSQVVDELLVLSRAGARELARAWGADVTLARAEGGGGVATVRFGVRG